VCKVAYKTNGVPFKILTRILWHPAFQAGYPVRFRVASNISKPTVRFNGHWLDIRLPPEYGRFISLLSRLTKQLRNGWNGIGRAPKIKVRQQRAKSPNRSLLSRKKRSPSCKFCNSERSPKQLGFSSHRDWKT